ncbi:MAG: hypothetical protein IT289_11690 [Oligoflexia bacterium]|nr:hypothetical protein [Oligoflexia bacterium]
MTLILGSSQAWAAPSLDDDLYSPQISSKKKSSSDDDLSIFDDVRLHAGVAYLTSFQEIPLGPGVRERGGINGFDLNFGIDLFSQHWIAEGHVMNFPETSLGDSRVSSNGFGLRILYDTAVAEGLTVHGGVGVASRAFNIKSTSKTPLNRRFDRTFQTGSTVLVGGIDYWPTGQLSFGLEISNHLPMASDQDPNSLELAIKLNGHF